METHTLVGVNKFDWVKHFEIIVEHFDVIN
jgi:hypothetical protein